MGNNIEGVKYLVYREKQVFNRFQKYDYGQGCKFNAFSCFYCHFVKIND